MQTVKGAIDAERSRPRNDRAADYLTTALDDIGEQNSGSAISAAARHRHAEHRGPRLDIAHVTKKGCRAEALPLSCKDEAPNYNWMSIINCSPYQSADRKCCHE
jgi:hypothetical protein